MSSKSPASARGGKTSGGNAQNLTDSKGTTPGIDDVLCGRGGLTNTHVGNKRYRAVVAQHQAQYLVAKRSEKETIAKDIVKIVRERGGRFLGKDGEGCWEEIGDKKAVTKTSQALREGLDVRKQSIVIQSAEDMDQPPPESPLAAVAAAVPPEPEDDASKVSATVASAIAAATAATAPASAQKSEDDSSKGKFLSPLFTRSTPPKPGDPSDLDVMCGRGGRTNTHPGNQNFRRIVAEHQPDYLTAKKMDKEGIAREVVHIIKNQGGRFVQKSESGAWEEIDDHKAIMKACQALREGLDIRNKVGTKSPSRSSSGGKAMAAAARHHSEVVSTSIAAVAVQPGQPESKRRKVEIISRLSVMPRKELEIVARLALEATTDKAVKAAAAVMERSKQRQAHCRRCHKAFDPVFAGMEDCVMEEHDETQWVRTPGGSNGDDRIRSGCCGKRESEKGPCWKGMHLVGPFDVSSGYWKDVKISETTRGWSGKTTTECVGCQFQSCPDCCTCGTLRAT